MIKFILNIFNSDLFVKIFILYCVGLYLFTLYHISTLTSVFQIKFTLGALFLGCVVGEILGLSIVWYLDNFYFPTLENNIDLTDINTNIESYNQNKTESTETNFYNQNKTEFTEQEKQLKKNTRNTLKWFGIIYIIVLILYSP